VVLEHLETLVAQARDGDGGAGLPEYVEGELRAMAACGDPAAGFLRVRCDVCGHDLLCPFSCGSRTVCPSCGTRRMEAMAARICDEVLPPAPLRQWTVSFPFALRRVLAADGALFSSVHRAFVRLVFNVLRASAPAGRGHCGAIAFTQRFDASLGLDPHIHLVCIDGVYARRQDGALDLHDTGTPSTLDVETVTARLHGSIRRILRRRGLLTEDGDLAPRESQATTPLERLYEAAARDFVPSGALDEAGRPILRRSRSGPQHLGPRLVDLDGVNLHADLRVEADDQAGRERLVRYLLRPPFADAQIEETADGRIALVLRKRRKNGDTHRFFTPLAFLRRLAWLIPRPREHLVRYEGVLAPASSFRELVAPGSTLRGKGPERSPQGAAPLPPPPSPSGSSRPGWAALLKRVYGVDVLACPTPGCGGRMRAVASILDPSVVRRILVHLGIPAKLPTFAPARDPPGSGADSLC
jgi:ribosomal protein S27E